MKSRINGGATSLPGPAYRDQWIDEAIANYLACSSPNTKKNPDHTLHVWLVRYRRQLAEKLPGAPEAAGDIGALSIGPRLNSSKSPDGYEEIIYSKGTWIIHMLREMLRQPGAGIPTRALSLSCARW